MCLASVGWIQHFPYDSREKHEPGRLQDLGIVLVIVIVLKLFCLCKSTFLLREITPSPESLWILTAINTGDLYLMLTCIDLLNFQL